MQSMSKDVIVANSQHSFYERALRIEFEQKRIPFFLKTILIISSDPKQPQNNYLM